MLSTAPLLAVLNWVMTAAAAEVRDGAGTRLMISWGCSALVFTSALTFTQLFVLKPLGISTGNDDKLLLVRTSQRLLSVRSPFTLFQIEKKESAVSACFVLHQFLACSAQPIGSSLASHQHDRRVSHPAWAWPLCPRQEL